MKTAEEILREKIIELCPAELKPYSAHDFDKWKNQTTGEVQAIEYAMREFAAQEVEAYKERIKSEIGERITCDNHDSCAQAFDSGLHTALTIIDTVK